MDLTAAAAYHGQGWSRRTQGHEQDIRDGHLWAALKVSGDHDLITDVVLHCPAPARLSSGTPNALQHLDRLDHSALQRDMNTLAEAYQDIGVTVHELPEPNLPANNPYCGANSMYARDLLWMTQAGAVIPRMASTVRAGEELQTLRLCARLGIPVVRTITADGTFEGADALWLRPDLVGLGLGMRTNTAGAQQIEHEARQQGATTLRLTVPKGVQHLLGVLQVLDAGLLAARTSIMNQGDIQSLRDHGFTIIDIPESDEVTSNFAFNFVTVAPRVVLMPQGASSTAALLARHGVECMAQIPVPELIKGAGGIACATGILARTPLD